MNPRQTNGWVSRASLTAVAIAAMLTTLGCASHPDALRTAIATSDATAAALSAARDALQARITERITTCASACADAPCVSVCGQQTLAEVAPTAARLDIAIALHGAAVEGIETARACRASEAACEDEAGQLARAALQLTQAAAMLKAEVPQ